MRPLAISIITQAAVDAGILAAAVLEDPETPEKLRPVPRIELTVLEAKLERDGKLFAKIPHATEPRKHVIHRRRLYKKELPARVLIVTNNEATAENLYDAFVSALPRQTKDAGNNAVVVGVERAKRGGFKDKIVEVFVKRSVALYLVFKGGLYQDTDIPWITHVNIKDGMDFESNPLPPAPATPNSLGYQSTASGYVYMDPVEM